MRTNCIWAKRFNKDTSTDITITTTFFPRNTRTSMTRPNFRKVATFDFRKNIISNVETTTTIKATPTICTFTL
jgi:hypothetical protein